MTATPILESAELLRLEPPTAIMAGKGAVPELGKVIGQLKDIVLPLSVTVTVSVFPLREPVVAENGVFGLTPYSNSCARAAISARRHVHSAFVVTRAPFMNVNGSGRNEFVGKDAKEGIGGMVHSPPPPLPLCVTATVCDGTPVAETVTVAMREEVFVFSCAVTVTVPSPEPEVGLTVNQV